MGSKRQPFCIFQEMPKKCKTKFGSCLAFSIHSEFFFLNKKDVLPWNKTKQGRDSTNWKQGKNLLVRKMGNLYIYMTRIFEPLRSFHHLESLPLPSATEYKQLLSEHCSVIQQPQQTLELPKETFCVFRHWNKTTKMKSCTSSSITYELCHASKTDEL